MRTGNTIR
ncbi:hypothetical protein KGM_207481A, partial [Danaus plexippus plexippus]